MPEQMDRNLVLVVEDEYFIAHDCAKVLTECGCQVAGPFCRLEDAFQFLDEGSERIDGALLDVNLQGSAVYPLLERLLEMKIPIALYTGYAADYLPKQFRDLPVFTKPEPTCKAAEYICNRIRQRPSNRIVRH
jgi:CheY-like chemotaxis protein